MSASQSDLSNPRYGYDFVVATTQASINATMKQFLANLSQPVATICYVADNQGTPVPIPYADLVQRAHGSDPFTVAAGADPTTNPDLKNLIEARFMMGFRAQLGLPQGLAPSQIPDLVQLGADTAAVTFNLLCSQFLVVDLEPGSGYAPPAWLSMSQPGGAPWIFTSKVDLRLSTTDSSAYSTLPPAVQQQIRNLGANAFSVQQLLFDLDNAGLQSIPTIQGITPGTKLYTVMQQSFLGAYFAQLQSQGQPILGVAITQPSAPASTLTLTNLNLEVSPFVDGSGHSIAHPDQAQQDLAALSYLCAADGHPLPAPVPFAWNWIDLSEEADYDGVIAINRRSIANYFRVQLEPYARNNSYLAAVRVWLSGFLDTTVNYQWSLAPGQTPTITMPDEGTVVLTMHYDSASNDDAGLNGDMGAMELKPAYDLTVTFSGNTITVVQHLVIYLYVRSLATGEGGNIVDRTITDTYTLAVTESGSLTAVFNSSVEDHSQDPSTNGFLDFFTDLNSIIDDVKTWVRAFVPARLQDIPVAVIQDYVFPGGKTFAFKSVGFSNTADLVSHITYTDPT